jgi:omega-6 fatty acid desaturase (delta-12 desaturase)
MRVGAELVRASQVYAKEDVGTTWRLLLGTLAPIVALWALVLSTDLWWLELPSSVLLGLIGVRLFIFFHDYCHDAIFTDSKLGGAVMSAVGFYTLSVTSVWRETHNYHHRNNAKLTGSAIGSYPTVTLAMYRGLTVADRRKLKAIRHPITIALGLFTTFFIGFCYAAFRRDPKQHWAAPVSGLVWIAVFVALGLSAGWGDAVWLWMLPCALHAGLGSYLFYAQHNFPGIELRGRREWEYSHAALRCSSMFDMSPMMHWFTGNIGFHHVHHLNHRIPFYRLPEAMAGMPELQDPIRTSWRLSDIRAALACSVWDGDAGRMISFEEADAAVASAVAAAAK